MQARGTVERLQLSGLLAFALNQPLDQVEVVELGREVNDGSSVRVSEGRVQARVPNEPVDDGEATFDSRIVDGTSTYLL